MNSDTTLEVGGIVPLVILTFKVIGWASVVILLSLFGWSITSLHVLAGWSDGDVAARLEIVRGMLASIGAGVVVALGGYYYQLPLAVICLSIFFAGMAGQKFLVPAGERILGRLMGAFDGFFGKNGNGTKP